MQYVTHLNSLKKHTSPEQLPSVGLFSGGGGLDLGLSFAGFRFSYATDIEESCVATLQYNFPECYSVAKNVCNITGDEIRQAVNSDEIELLAGGSPCQSFSILGKRAALTDKRGKLIFEHIRLINELQPKAFLFENVPGILSSNKGKDWRLLLEAFAKSTGYEINNMVLNAANYGVPQIRNRVFIVGFRELTNFSFPEPLLSPEQWIASAEALTGCEGLPNHVKRLHSARIIERYASLEPGMRDKVDRTDRIHPDKPSGTVLVGSGNGGGRPFIHPTEHRTITTREAARLQSFPDWYVFKGTPTQQYRQVGNAVPVLLAKAIGESIKAALEASKG